MTSAATEYTKKANRAVYDLLDFDDTREFENARRGLLAAPEELEITDETGKVVWSQAAYDFIDGDAPDTANPSLWRNTQLNHVYGLFEVTKGIYQVRGYDVSNITFIEGETGWVVFDPLTSVEPARAALELINDTLGERPVTGIVISHTHGDHFGGIKGIVSEEEVRERNIPIIAPEHFAKYAMSENVCAGSAMFRRSSFMYGRTLEAGPQGRLGIGLSTALAEGAASYISPTITVTQTGERHTVDGVTMEFQMVPETEAPAEMTTWFPEKKVLWMAELCTGTLHNLYTLRGAQVRDGNAWANYIMEALTLYGDEAEIAFQSHNWPHWGNADVREYLTNSAAAYKFINDQTLFYLNQGYTSDEIANMIELPKELAQVWYTRPYYGTVAHNSKAVYQRYLGWYDANPAHLHPLPPTERAQKYVEYLGDVEAVLARARKDFENGEYRWVADITSMLVFADPTCREARELGAEALEQLGYQAECGTWRAAYLSGAKELREGASARPNAPHDGRSSNPGDSDLVKAMEPEMFFDYLNLCFDSNAAQSVNAQINVNVLEGDAAAGGGSQTVTPYLLTVRAGVLLHQKGASADNPDLTITVPQRAVALLITPKWKESEFVRFEGDASVIDKLQKHLAQFDPAFNIIEP